MLSKTAREKGIEQLCKDLRKAVYVGIHYRDRSGMKRNLGLLLPGVSGLNTVRLLTGRKGGAMFSVNEEQFTVFGGPEMSDAEARRGAPGITYLYSDEYGYQFGLVFQKHSILLSRIDELQSQPKIGMNEGIIWKRDGRGKLVRTTDRRGRVDSRRISI